MKYYRNFLTIANPLADDHELTANDFNAEFFRGFHKDDQDILAEQILFNVNPRHPATAPFDVQDVLTAARQYFANNRFHKPLERRVRSELRGRSKTRRSDPEKLIHQLFGDKRVPRPAACDDDSDSDQDEDRPRPARSRSARR